MKEGLWMFLCFDIGGTHIKYGVITESGTILKKETIATKSERDDIYQSLLDIYHHEKVSYKLIGIGVSIPGIVGTDGQMITAGAIRSLYGENVKEYLETMTGLPITIDNDANAAAIAEKWLGNARNLQNYLCLVLGTGVGGGIIINGQVYTGANGMAGEIGWGLIKEIPEEGSLESVSLNQRAATINGLCRLYNQERKSQLKETVPIYDAQKIIEEAMTGNQLARKVTDRFISDLAVGLLNIISFFDPEAILIGGGISQNPIFSDLLSEKVKELKQRHESLNYLLPSIDTPIIMAKLKNDAGMLGAGYQIRCKIINDK